MTAERSNPLVSIIVPAYNAERFIVRALDSAVRQTYANLEIVIVDDGSNDRTPELIGTLRDPRIHYLQQPNRGQGSARTSGLRASTGAYITFLDADDYYRPDKIERQVAWLEAHPAFGAVFCNALHFYSDAPGRFFGRSPHVVSGDIFPALLRSSLINPNTLMVRGRILRNRFAFCEQRYYPEEWDLCLRLSRAGVRFGYQDEDLVVVEVRENSNTTMDIQWILKRNALRMFQGLFAEMSDDERLMFRTGQVLQRCKLNLAAAYLVAGDKTAFGEIVSEIFHHPAAWAVRAAVNAMPTGLLRRAATRVWRWRQFHSFRVRPGPPDGARMTAAVSSGLPSVSVIVPVWNEADYIEGCLARLLEQTYPPNSLEILIVNGLSRDGTRELVHRFVAPADTGPDPKGRARVRIIDAPGPGRPVALNAGIRQARGEVIARVDARTVIPPDYVERCVRALIATGADNVGGLQRPIARGTAQQAIGLAMSHPFGVGNAQFRIGKKSGFVDTVYLGCFRREVFDRVGLFDEESVLVSEDSDINQRIRKSGGRVYLDTGIIAQYYPRDTLPGLWRLYFRYGGARAGNLLKHGKLTSWRQAVPAVFVLALAVLGVLSLASRPALLALGALLAVYAVCDVAVSTALTGATGSLRVWPWICAAFPTMHFGWAFGFFKRLAEWRRPTSSWAWTERS